MNILRCFLLAVIVVAFPVSAFSVGANPNPIEVVQPDGTTLQLRVRGDEWNHWTSSVDGYHIVKNTDGIFEYATENALGEVVASGVKVSNINNRTKNETAWLSGRSKKMLGNVQSLNAQKQYKTIRAINQRRVQKAQSAISGKFKLLVIMANFSDTQTRYTSANFNDLMNQSNYNGTGSFRDFYLENSNNMFDVESTVTTWVTVPQSHDYYGAEDKWGEFAYQAVKAAYNSGVDLSNFDNDGDGVVDAVAIFHQGKGQEATDEKTDIWSHSWSLSSAGYSYSQRTFGSVRVDGYIVQPELNGNSTNMSTIGVTAHEFGHALGAYDFYDTDYDKNGQYEGTGSWDLMASGCYNGSPSGSVPAHHNAYSKIQFGWAQSQLITEPQQIKLPPVVSSQTILRVNTKTENEYFLLENRKRTGFDAYLNGEGMLVYHVDDNYITANGSENALNATSHEAMYIIAANLVVNSTGCPFPGANNVVEFHDTTTPSSLSWARQTTEKSITNIVLENDTVKFDFMSFQDGLPKSFTASMVGENQVKVVCEKRSANDKLLIAYSSQNIFGTPQIGVNYQVNDILPGGGKVLMYSNSQSELVHEVDVQNTYYYKVWADKGTRYSTSINTSVNGWRKVYFYLNDNNGQPLEDATIECSGFQGKTDSEGSLMFYGNFAAQKLNRYEIKKEGYQDKWGVFSAQSSSSVYADLVPVGEWNIKIRSESVNNKNVALSWEPVIDENFSSYTPFATSINNWTFVDNDKLPTYGFSDYHFDNEGYTGSFIVFDGYSDSFVNNGGAIESVSGRQFLAAFSGYSSTSSSFANDDWMISPEISVDSTCWLSFYAASFTDEFGFERLKVLVSTASGSTTSFSKINAGKYLTIPTEWTMYKYDLSGYKGQKIRFALNCVSSDAFVLMLDRIRITSKEPFENSAQLAALKSAQSSFAGSLSTHRQQIPVLKSSRVSNATSSNVSGSINYQIYRNGEIVGTTNGFGANSFADVTSECGIQNYQIKAVDGVTGNITESNTRTLINCLQNTLVSSNPSNGVFQFQLPDNVSGCGYSIYNINGSLVDKGVAESYQFTLNMGYLPSGLYVVKLVYANRTELVKLIKK